MGILEALQGIHTLWLTRTVQKMARGAGVRENFRDQLEQYRAMLEQAVDTGDPAWLDPVLRQWADSLTESDLANHQSSLVQVLGIVFATLVEVAQETLDAEIAVQIIAAVTPCFACSFEKAAQYESQARVNYITAKLTEAQQALERLDESKSNFISVAAHELRTPLTLVEGYAAMLREKYPENGENNTLSSDIQLLDGINHGTKRLRGIIDDMLDVSLIDNNMLSLNFQPIWINRLFLSLGTELQMAVAERKQELIIRNFPGSSEMTFGDPERLLQMLRNVLTNAIKYTPDGGKIIVNGRQLPGFIEIIIKDNGIGIDPDDQQMIFEKFGRLGNTALHSSGKTKFKGGGPGLGLHIARGIIESHGGAIWVESPGFDESRCPGSTFHILLPLRKEPPDDKTAKLFAPLIQMQHPL